VQSSTIARVRAPARLRATVRLALASWVIPVLIGVAGALHIPALAIALMLVVRCVVTGIRLNFTGGWVMEVPVGSALVAAIVLRVHVNRQREYTCDQKNPRYYFHVLSPGDLTAVTAGVEPAAIGVCLQPRA
jgi:hypothetical protein